MTDHVLKPGSKISGVLVSVWAVERGPNAQSNRSYDAYYYLEERDAKYMAAGMHDKPKEAEKKTNNITSEREDARIHRRLALKLDGQEVYYVFTGAEPVKISSDGSTQLKQVKGTIFAVLTPLEREVIKEVLE